MEHNHDDVVTDPVHAALCAANVVLHLTLTRADTGRADELGMNVETQLHIHGRAEAEMVIDTMQDLVGRLLLEMVRRDAAQN